MPYAVGRESAPIVDHVNTTKVASWALRTAFGPCVECVVCYQPPA